MINAFLNTTHCTVSTLSPVHIGCGEDYYPTNYVIDDGLLHHFSEEGLLAALTLPEKNGLAKIAEEQGDNGIKKLQRFIYGIKGKLQTCATHSVPLSKQLEAFYQDRINQKEKNKLEIARHAFNPYTQTPYFPGSSIKGAMRTALLNALNGNKPLPPEFRGTEKRNVPDGANNVLQKRLLKYEETIDDPLRLLKIGDASYQHPETLHSLEVHFAVNRKKEKKGPYQILECLPAHRSRRLNFDVTFLTGEKQAYCQDIKMLAKVCNTFFLSQLQDELKLIEEFRYTNPLWIKGIRNLLENEWHEAFEKQQAFLCRIGQHSGAVSHTLAGVRHIHIPQIKKYLPKPTTIWLAGNHKDQQHDLLPFGWVLIEIGDFVLDKTHAFLKAQAAPDYHRQEQLQQLAAQRAEFLTKEQQKRERQALQKAEDAEQERLKQAAEDAKAQQMAAMSEAQQAIYVLQQEYLTAKTRTPEPNGTLRESLAQAIKKSGAWTPVEKLALWEIGNQLCAFWGKPKKLKDQLKSLQG